MHDDAGHALWETRWREGRIGFHRPAPNDDLVAWADVAWPRRGRVLVPLCGKSVDLAWLGERFDEVVGVEFVPEAARAFFVESLGVEPTRHDASGAALAHCNITIRVQDMLTLDPAVVGTFDAVWDRAALIALPPDVRARYANHLVTLMAPGARGLLVTLDYPQALMAGPPFSVADDEVLALFSPATTAERLARRAVNEQRPAMLDATVPIHTSTWILTRE